MTDSPQELFNKFVEVVAKLRDPNGGCPWDLEQTHASLKQYLIEEAYEVLEAIDNEPEKLSDELGDVLLQVVLHSQIASEAKRFNISEVVQKITEKMIHRHPHVFGDQKLSNSEQVLNQWEKNKRKDLPANKSILDGVPRAMPSLQRAQRVGEKAARVGFEWPTLEGVRDKVFEEMQEFLECCNDSSISIEKKKEEFGDILFAMTQLSRRLQFNSEELLHTSTDKFIRRFKQVEKRVGGDLKQHSLEELDILWEQVKAEEK